jgi:cytidyltransferase-like protein
MSDLKHITAGLQASIQTMYGSRPHPVLSLLVTGGGMQVVPWLLCTPGASACIMSADVPYARVASEKVITDYTGALVNTGSTCREQAILLAKAAFQKTCESVLRDNHGNINEYLSNVSSVMGVGCTAALVSAVTKRGDHRCHIAVYTDTRCESYSITLIKGTRDRPGEDAVCSQLILEAILKQTNPALLPPGALLQVVEPNLDTVTAAPLEQVTTVTSPHSDALEKIYERKIKYSLYFKRQGSAHHPAHGTGGASDDYLVLEDARLPAGTIIYPGSFNPLHEGHLALARAALNHAEAEHLATPALQKRKHADQCNITETAPYQPPMVVFEIGALNADKPPLPREEVLRRLAQFDVAMNPLFEKYGLTNIAVCITSEPLFLGKSYLFPGCRFAVGADTMVRLVNGKYYQDPPQPSTETDLTQKSCSPELLQHRGMTNMVAALTRIAENKCSFIVGGRVKTPAAPAVPVDVDQTGSATVSSTAGTIPAAAVYQTCASILRDSYAVVTGSVSSHSSRVPSKDMSVEQVLPHNVVSLFHSLTEAEFRLDLSSTEIRARTAALATVPATTAAQKGRGLPEV